MTPPGSYRNFLLGRSGAVLEHSDLSGSVSQLQALARLSATTQANVTSRRSDTAMRLLLQGTERAGNEIQSTVSEHSDATVQQALDAYLGLARGGDRRSHYDAIRCYFVLVHRYLNNPERHAEVPRLLRDFRQITREYRDHLAANTTLQPEDRLRYLFAAAGVVRNMLGRVQVNEAARTAAGGEIEELRGLLRSTYEAILDHYRQHLLAHPNGESYSGVFREIQMRQALLEGNQDVARQRALELAQWLTAHPPPAEDLADESTLRWDYMAARALTSDPDFATLVRGMDTPSSPENTIAMLNGVSWELVQTVCATLDQVNEDSEATITARYRSLATVVSVLTLTRPYATLSDILADLGNPSQADAIRQEVETAAHDSAEVNRILTEARGDTALDQFIARAREGARHVQQLREGAGRNVLATILNDNSRLNGIRDLAEALGSHPGLTQSLGLAAEDRNNPTALRRLATELFRRGPLGISAVEEYGNAHPDDGVQGILAMLRETGNAQTTINTSIEAVLNAYQENLNHRPDHELAAIHSVFQLISQTNHISEGISLQSALSTQARSLTNRLESYEFRTRRVFSHLTSGSSVITLGAGILLAETLPAVLISRAGTSGRLAAPLLGELVSAGRLTGMGSAVTGIGSGLAMSLIGTGLNTRERASLGMRTHFWRDFGESAVTNTVVFGATIPFARGMGRWLTPAAEEGAAVGQLSRLGRLGVHATSTLFGGTVALGFGALWRGVNTGRWSLPSYDEVAENYLSILFYETGAAAFRGFRSRVGLRAELEGRPVFNPAESQYRLVQWGNRRMASVLNTLFTNLGPARAARINSLAASIVEGLPAVEVGPDGQPVRDAEGNPVIHRVGGSPQLIPAREFIAHQLALRELSAPGSLDEINEAFLTEHRAFIRRRGRNMVLEFDHTTTSQEAPRGYTADLVAALRRLHLDNASSSDADYLPRFLPNDPAVVFEIRVDRSGRIVSINGHNLGDTEGSVSINASYDPATRQLRLPPVGRETAPRVLDLGPMLDAHRSSPVPLLWTSELGARVLARRMDSATRARVNQTIDNLNRDHAVEIMINVDTGEIINNVRFRENPPSNILHLIGRYSGEEKTVTLPAPRGAEGEYVLDMESGEITHRLPERTEGSSEGRRSGGRSGRETRRRPERRDGRRERAEAREEAEEGASDADAAAVDEALRESAARIASRGSSTVSPQLSSTLRAAIGRSVPNSQQGVLTEPARDATGPVEVTVYLGRQSGKILGISRGHHPVTRDPEHIITENLPSSGRLPRINRISLQGTLDETARRIVLEVPAAEDQAAGRLIIDLGIGRIRFEANPSAPEGPGGGTPPPSPPPSGGTDSPPQDGSSANAAPVTVGSEPPAEGSGEGSGASTAHPDGIDDNAVTGRFHAANSEVTGPQPAILATEDIHAPLDLAEILDPGDTRAVIGPNGPTGLRGGQHRLLIPGIGEVSAFTDAGYSKHFPPRNEDAYGVAVANDGSLVVVVADGAGGSSTGEAASARAVQTVLEQAVDPTVSLGSAFRTAHDGILSDLTGSIDRARAECAAGGSVPIPEDSYTVATALRFRPNSAPEVATVGDTQVWVARPREGGSHEILAPYLPASIPGVQRAGNAPGVTDTVGMNAASGYILSRLGGAPGEAAPPISSRIQSGLPFGIFNAELTLPGPNGERLPFTPQAGDLFLLMSDGVHTLFNRRQMGETIQGLDGAEEVRRAVQTETLSRLDLVRNLVIPLQGTTRRTRIGAGRFEGNYIDANGDIHDAETGGNRIGHVGPDNIVLLVVRYNPSTGADSSTGGE
ncbi:MAG: protein phosphatase 2C domain-containing protein [bacterium]